MVGLAREGREAVVCFANAGANQLMSVIRSAILRPPKTTRSSSSCVSATPDRAERVSPTRYTSRTRTASTISCDLLDLALLAEIDVLESTIWDESVQRLQGLAISPGEVRGAAAEAGRPPRARARPVEFAASGAASRDG